MKKLILISLTFLISCGQEQTPNENNEYSYDKLDERGGLIYSSRLANTPFTGIAIKNYDNGQLQLKANYVSGKLEGLKQTYYENGQQRTKENYQDGIRFGLSQDFLPNGSIDSEGCYRDDQLIEFSMCKPIYLWCSEQFSSEGKEQLKSFELIKKSQLTPELFMEFDMLNSEVKMTRLNEIIVDSWSQDYDDKGNWSHNPKVHFIKSSSETFATHDRRERLTSWLQPEYYDRYGKKEILDSERGPQYHFDIDMWVNYTMVKINSDDLINQEQLDKLLSLDRYIVKKTSFISNEALISNDVVLRNGTLEWSNRLDRKSLDFYREGTLNIQYILDRQDLFLREITEYDYKLQDAEKRQIYKIIGEIWDTGGKKNYSKRKCFLSNREENNNKLESAKLKLEVIRQTKLSNFEINQSKVKSRLKLEEETEERLKDNRKL